MTTVLRDMRRYKNPDFLQKMVDHFGIDHVGSCFPKEVFDPKKLPEEDYYDRYTALVSPTPQGTPQGHGLFMPMWLLVVQSSASKF